MLEFEYANEGDIPAANKAFYAKVGDAWILQVNGAVPKRQVEEYRNNNISLMKERDALKEKFKDVDPDEARRLKSISDQLDEGKIIKKEGLEAAVELRVGKMKEKYDKDLADAQGVIKKTREEMGRLKIDKELVAKATAAGLRPEAAEDFVARGQKIFQLDDEGNVVAMKAGTAEKLYGQTGAGMGIDEWVGTVAKDKTYSHLFQSSQGAGAPGGAQGGGAGGGADNPWTKGKENFTDQGRIMKADPARAAALKAAAGA